MARLRSSSTAMEASRRFVQVSNSVARSSASTRWPGWSVAGRVLDRRAVDLRNVGRFVSGPIEEECTRTRVRNLGREQRRLNAPLSDRRHAWHQHLPCRHLDGEPHGVFAWKAGRVSRCRRSCLPVPLRFTRDEQSARIRRGFHDRSHHVSKESSTLLAGLRPDGACMSGDADTGGN